LAFAGAGIARVAGILEFQAAELDQIVTAALEIAFSVITLWLYRAWPAAFYGGDPVKPSDSSQ
jgi:hypothetical protein